MEGRLLGPLLKGGKASVSRVICWEHEGNRAVREGDWKLVSKFPSEWELYNLRADRTEQNDLAALEPARVKDLLRNKRKTDSLRRINFLCFSTAFRRAEAAFALTTKWDAWAQRALVKPWDDVRAAK